MRSLLSLLAGTLLLMPKHLEAQSTAVKDVDLDHVILGARSLTHAMDTFARLTGVTPKRGGQHPGRGTENALVSLGEGHYLEILAPINPPADSSSQPTELAPMGWALHTKTLDDLIAQVRAAGFELNGPTPGSRLTPDSALLKWRTAAVIGPGLELAPFFIEWSASTPHPSTTSPGGCKLTALTMGNPDPARLREFFRAVGYTVEVQTNPSARLRVTLDCPRGRVTFPT